MMGMAPRLRPILLLLAAAAAVAAAPAGAQAVQEAPAKTVERCRSPNAAKERECYWAALAERLESGGAAPALELLDRLAALDPDVRRDGHMHAHRIGINALKSPEEVGRVFATCTPGHQSGCYHGVIQGYFIAVERSGGAVDTASVDALCGDWRGTRVDLLFQCTHGLGHGLAILHRHDLPDALRSCDLLSREAEQEMCWAGAFMETLVNFTHPHHAGTAPEKAGAHSGHGDHHDHGKPAAAAAAPAKPPFRALDPKDLHYPCSAMGEKYLIACYTIQTSAMLHHADGDVGRVAAECGRAPEKARATCFLSLGRDVSGLAPGNIPKAVRLCGLAEATFRPVCHRGVVESIVNTNAVPAEGIPYCRALPEAESKRLCYAAIRDQALVLPDGAAKRDAACAAAEAEFRGVCLGREPAVTPAAAAPGSARGRP